MGTLIGHVAPGFTFLLIGLWHLFNHIKLFSLHPNSYLSSPWFPFPKFRRLELLLIAVASSISISMELFISPQHHQPLDSDLTIPSNHLHNFEHASISLSFLLFSAFAALFDSARPPAAPHLTILAASAAFANQLLLFHLHSSDHMGVEGQYHSLLQLVIAVTLVTTIMGISHARSFAVGFVRSTSIALQGVWFVVMGFALWTPELIAKGCFINDEDGHQVVRCKSEEALRRAKSLVVIQFSWIFVVVVASSMVFYVVLSRRYVRVVEEYLKVGGDYDDSEDLDLEEEKRSFVSLEKGIRNVNDLER